MQHTPKIAAFLEQVNSGKMVKDQHRIYHLINGDNRGWHYKAVKQALSMKESTTAGRLSDLTDMGLIYQVHNLYFITPEDKIEAYANARKMQRYERWKKLGEEMGWFGQHRVAL